MPGPPGTTSPFNSSVAKTDHAQVANYSLTAPDGSQVSVEFGPDTTYGRSTWQVPAPAGGGALSILVAGMLPGANYHMRALVQLQNGTTVPDRDYVFTTGALPTKFPNAFPKIAVTSPGQPNPGVELINMVHPSFVSLVTDLAGNILWYYPNLAAPSYDGCPMPIKPLPNGNLMVSITNRYAEPPPKNPYCSLREVDLAGDTVVDSNGQPRQLDLDVLNEKLQTIKTPQGRVVQVNYYSHDFLLLPNAHVILLCQEFLTVDGTEVWGDALVDLDETFTPVWVWSMFDYPDVVPITRHPMGLPDWTHSNAVLATPDGNLLLSVRAQSWVLKLDYAGGTGTGDILWILGFEGSFELSTGPADWFFAQHFPWVFATSGNDITQLSVMDNGNYRVASDPPPYSRALILRDRKSVV